MSQPGLGHGAGLGMGGRTVWGSPGTLLTSRLC